MAEQGSNIVKYKNASAIILFLTFWFVTISFAGWIKVDTIALYVIRFIPSLIVLGFLSFLVISGGSSNSIKLNKLYTFPLSDPVVLFYIYLFWAMFSLLYSMPKASSEYFFKGFGYLFGYIVAIINIFLIYNILFSQQNIIDTDSITSLNNTRDPVARAAFCSIFIILVVIFFMSFRTLLAWSSDRILSGLQPATIGLLVMGVIIYTIAYRPTIPRIIICGIGLILVAKGYSRTSMIAISFSAVMVLLLRYRVFSALMVIGLVALIIFMPGIVYMISEDVLYLHDPEKGVGYLSGRTAIWGFVWQLFLKNPIIGIGFRMSDTVVQKALGEASVHNVYLTTLAETGIVGTFFMMLAVCFALYRLFIMAWKYQDKNCIFYFGVLMGASIFGMAESNLINIGNVSSIICLVGLIYSRIKYNIYLTYDKSLSNNST